MEQHDAIALANAHLSDHGCDTDGWSAVINPRLKRALGRAVFTCKHGMPVRNLELSAYLVEHNDEYTIEQTILHEVAHVLAGFKAGHGPEWKRIARMLGHSAERLNGIAKAPTRPWRLVCTVCDTTLCTRHKRMNLNGRYHPRCGKDSVGRLEWQRNS